MEKVINCKNCASELVVINDKLFFSEVETETTISCPICNKTVDKMKTDGWFFVQTVTEYEKEKVIERKKEKLSYSLI